MASVISHADAVKYLILSEQQKSKEKHKTSTFFIPSLKLNTKFIQFSKPTVYHLFTSRCAFVRFDYQHNQHHQNAIKATKKWSF